MILKSTTPLAVLSILVWFITGSIGHANVICESPASDPDGDGWGWENDQSCRVMAGPAGTTGPDMSIPDTSIPDTSIPDTSIPDTTGPDTTGPEPTSTDNAGGIPICQDPASDPDGDGFGWEQNASCLVGSSDTGTPQPDASPESPTTPTPDTTITEPTRTDNAGGIPICMDPASDPDGDGFGWEQNASCLVSSSEPANPQPDASPESPTAATPDDTPTAASPAFPTCVSDASDPDGDGFGWEDGATCIVGEDSTSAGNTDEDTTTAGNMDEGSAPDSPPEERSTPTSSANPVCESEDSDPDGDGFGWENSQTCVVVLQDSTDSPNPTDLLPTGLPVRIMAVGDSITRGVREELVESYRSSLVSQMMQADCSFEMVGSQTGNSGHNSFVSPHESYSGHRVDHFLTGSGNNAGIAISMERYTPNLVLLFLGTNDILGGQNIADTVAEMDMVIATILDGGASVLVANTTPIYRSSDAEQRQKQYSDQLEAYVAQLGNTNVSIVDVNSDFTRAMILSDDLHPNHAGDAHIAQQFYEAIVNHDFCLVPDA